MKHLLTVAGLLAFGFVAVKAQQDDALLDALVKKGVLSSKEANDVRADAAKSYANNPASKISFSSYVTKIKVYGDARLRYEYLDETPQDPGFNGAGTAATNGTPLGHNSSTTDRVRYRLRFGLDYSFTDNFKGGFELESATNGDSANQTLGNAYEKYPINIGLVYLQYNPTDWVQLVAGKFKQPLYTTDLTWDPDINPEGGSESFTFNIPLGGHSAPSDPKDVKAIHAPSDFDPSLTIGFTAAQFIYADNNEFNNTNSNVLATSQSGSNLDRTDVWTFVEQVPVQFNYNKTTFAKVVPEFTSYFGGGNTGLSSNVVGATAGSSGIGGGSAVSFANPHAADHLQIFGAPGEVDWKVGKIPMKAYWDFSYNLEGKERIQDTYLGNNQGPVTAAQIPGSTQAITQAQNRDLGDNVAWLAGLQVGNTLKKGDWSLRGDFRQVGLGAVDPNTNDSDWGDSFLNQQGIKVQGNYQFTDFLTGSVTYIDTWAYKNNLLNGSAGQNPVGLPLSNGGGVTQGGVVGVGPSVVAGGTTNETATLAGIHTSQRVEVDMQWKF